MRVSASPWMSNGDECSVYFSFTSMRYYTRRFFKREFPSKLNHAGVKEQTIYHAIIWHTQCHFYLYNRSRIQRDGFRAVITIHHRNFKSQIFIFLLQNRSPLSRSKHTPSTATGILYFRPNSLKINILKNIRKHYRCLKNV